MEKNTIQRETTTINISVYSPDYKDLADVLSQLSARDENALRQFVLTAQDGSANNSENVPDLAIVISDEKADTLRKALDKKEIPYLLLDCGTDDIAGHCSAVVLELEKGLDSGFSIKDFSGIYNRNITMDTVRGQLSIFRNGISKMMLSKPATIDDGIYPLNEDKAMDYAQFYDSRKDNFTIKKFVPASGAASRMFKFLSEFINEFNPKHESLNAYMNRKADNSLRMFFVGIDKLPFFKQILEKTKENPDYSTWNKDQRYFNFVQVMLSDHDFDYANKPKGILSFHQYEDFAATPVYEHLKEAAAYAECDKAAHVHFTISEEHRDGFLDAINEVKPQLEKESGVTLNFSFSYQHAQTDTIAVDVNNDPFRDGQGGLLFRPGGHGALIENLSRLEADIVFVKNIDNVSHNNIETIALYKKALAGILIKLQEKTHMYLDMIDRGEVSEKDICGIFDFAKNKLTIDVDSDVSKYTLEHKLDYARELLNRPIRVCGMVKNEGEPGGGPFWIEGDKRKLSLQIVESSQIDLDDKEQKDILMRSTHFNPVDLVCGLKDYKGNYFDLNKFVDSTTGFIVYKNKNGKDLKSYELPGLWNGAMAGWITIFVEVPLDTFNPVKTVNDLLKPAHQPQ
ncbi:MAG: DUF4301 family protein [Flavobacterium sp.]|nr:MAG: DUF4301 family protein [Flavobacterium sp.]